MSNKKINKPFTPVINKLWINIFEQIDKDIWDISEEYYNDCDKLKESINDICNEIYNSITGINFENNIIPQPVTVEKESTIILSGPVVEETTKMGTSILYIKKEMQKSILEDMINKDDGEDMINKDDDDEDMINKDEN